MQGADRFFRLVVILTFVLIFIGVLASVFL